MFAVQVKLAHSALVVAMSLEREVNTGEVRITDESITSQVEELTEAMRHYLGWAGELRKRGW
jgi:hypothetical protein